MVLPYTYENKGVKNQGQFIGSLETVGYTTKKNDMIETGHNVDYSTPLRTSSVWIPHYLQTLSVAETS
jgi:hypothetical protein